MTSPKRRGHSRTTTKRPHRRACYGTGPCGARLFDLAWPGLRAQIIAE
jgi:hypothetical protein